MSRMKFPLICLLLITEGFLMPSQSLAQQSDMVASPKNPFELQVSPHSVIAYGNKPIYIKVTLKNLTNHDAYIRLWLSPVPFGPKTDLHCLMMRCRNQMTGKEIQYTWPPPGKTVADAQGKELPDKVYPDGFIKETYDLRQLCVLPPGRYTLDLQYDTRYTPSEIRRDIRAWHGITNRVTVKIHVLNSAQGHS